MATALPVTKLAGLLVKTFAKPLSKRIKHEFSRYETTQRLLVAIGRGAHQITSRMTIWSAGYRVRTISALAEDKALKQGAEFVGESFVLVVSAGTVLYEYNRSVQKEIRKAEKQRALAAAERKELQRKLKTLDLRLQALEDTVETNKASIFSFLQTSPQYVPPPSDKLVAIVDADDLDKEEEIQRRRGDVAEGEANSNVAVTLETNGTGAPGSNSSIESQKAKGRWWWPF